MCRAPSPNRSGSLSASTAARTRSRLSSGSPIPMNTTFVSRWPSAARRRAACADLVDDLGRLEVAGEAELAGRAERAADRAARLARDAQGVALALGAAGRVVHQDRLDRGRRPTAGGAPSRSGRRRTARVSVSSTVSKRNAAASASRSGGRQRPDVVERGGVVAATRRRRPGGRGTAGRSRAVEPGDEIVGQDAGDARAGVAEREPAPRLRPAGWPWVESTRSRSWTRTRTRPARRPDRRPGRGSRAGRAGTPRRVIGRPPAGWTSSSTSRPSAVASARPARSGTIRPGSSSASDGATAARQDDEPLAVGLEEGPRPRQVGPHLPLEQPRRGGRVEPAVRAAERPGHRRAVGRLRGRARSRRPARARASGRAARRPRSRGGPRGRAPSRPRRGPSAPGRRSARCRGRRPSGSGSPRSRVSPARIALGIGVAPRWRGRSDGWRFSAPCAQVEQLAGHDLAVVGEHDEVRIEPEDVGDRGRVAQPLRRLDVEARARAAWVSTGVGVSIPRRPTGRGGAVTTATSVDRRVGRAAGRASAGRTGRCRGRRSGRAREPGRRSSSAAATIGSRGPGRRPGHASAFAALSVPTCSSPRPRRRRRRRSRRRAGSARPSSRDSR